VLELRWTHDEREDRITIELRAKGRRVLPFTIASMALQHSVSLTLKDASEGLLFTSESDYPLTIWELPASIGAITTTTNDAIAVLSTVVPMERAEERVVETSDLSWFFDRYTEPQDWWEASHLKLQSRWQAIRSTVETELSDIQVLRIGQSSNWGLFGSIHIFVFGRALDGTIIGLHTITVET
jgi:Nuclease A inhibitor-like protein